MLQHGSILWESSSLAPEFPGFAQLTGCGLSSLEAFGRLGTEIPDVLNLNCLDFRLSGQSLDAIEQLAGKRYKQQTWTERR